jgi:2-keto-4-pentenoate hydratase/2-oxohepta-3-ene-1,7-dioic acid hydratase in catechol pathway
MELLNPARFKNCPKLIGAALNYYKSEAEAANGPTLPNPIMFLKRTDGIIGEEEKYINVDYTDKRYQPEVELGVLIGKTCKNMAESDWEEYVKGYFILFDITE